MLILQHGEFSYPLKEQVPIFTNTRPPDLTLGKRYVVSCDSFQVAFVLQEHVDTEDLDQAEIYMASKQPKHQVIKFINFSLADILKEISERESDRSFFFGSIFFFFLIFLAFANLIYASDQIEPVWKGGDLHVGDKLFKSEVTEKMNKTLADQIADGFRKSGNFISKGLIATGGLIGKGIRSSKLTNSNNSSHLT